MISLFGFATSDIQLVKTEKLRTLIADFCAQAEIRGRGITSLIAVTSSKQIMLSDLRESLDFMAQPNFARWLESLAQAEGFLCLLGQCRELIDQQQVLEEYHCPFKRNDFICLSAAINLADEIAGNKALVFDNFAEFQSALKSINCIYECSCASSTGELYLSENFYLKAAKLEPHSASFDIWLWSTHAEGLEDIQRKHFLASETSPLDQPTRLARCLNLHSFSWTKDTPPTSSPKLPAPKTTFIDLSSQVETIARCKSCILPATFPFIEFDENGVCHFCRQFQGHSLLGEEALLKTLDQHRRRDGSPDCIVAFSGGRDSSYGLHLLKTKYQMTPLAFTYDWGLVTDLARRNQARICGKLGIEHILISADIPRKRRYIKQNIEAWLRRPHLGIIPLFMAGDKHFFYHARQVRKNTGVRLVIFCGGSPFEQTAFKSGFAGIQENDHKSVITGLATLKKLQMALFYLQQFALNPAYLNSSLFDTAFAFWSTYIQPDENIHLFRYLPWDENLINQELKHYNWESASDSHSTWRVGDGTSSFYNYIYHRVAGFSEHDTFRSHQVRAGLITRDQALRLVKEDNEPRLQTLREYAATIGFSLSEALKAIHRMPRLY